MLATGTKYYFRNLSLILPVSLLAFAPAFAVIAISVDDAFRFDLGPVRIEVRYREMTSLVCGICLQAGLSLGAIRHLEGGYRDFGEDLIGSIQSLFRCVPVALAGVALVVVGLLAFVFPGLALATMLWVALPSAAVEHRGLVGALQRSFELTRGYRLRILCLLMVFLALGIAVEFAIGLASSFLVPGGLGFLAVAKQIGAILISGLVGSVAAVSYYDLRTLREGAASRAITQAFE